MTYGYNKATGDYTFVDNFDVKYTGMWDDDVGGKCGDGYNELIHAEDGKLVFTIKDWFNDGTPCTRARCRARARRSRLC